MAWKVRDIQSSGLCIQDRLFVVGTDGVISPDPSLDAAILQHMRDLPQHYIEVPDAPADLQAGQAAPAEQQAPEPPPGVVAADEPAVDPEPASNE